MANTTSTRVTVRPGKPAAPGTTHSQMPVRQSVRVDDASITAARTGVRNGRRGGK